MIVLLSGQARVGKDTAAILLNNIFINRNETCITTAYADFLKEILRKCFNLSHEQLYGVDKETPIEHLPIRTRSGKITNHYWTPRKLLQFLGTDVMRTIDPECWINVVKNFVDTYSNYDNIIITDARFANEVEWVLERGGTHIHITRENKDFSSGNDHASEVGLNEFFDERSHQIANNGSLEDLKNTLVNIINKEINHGR